LKNNLVISLHFDKVLLPARRIGQCWEATRAPKQVAEVWGRAICTALLLLFIPDGHPKYPTRGHLKIPHLYFHLRGMKKEKNVAIQTPIRHTGPKTVSKGGVFSSGHPGFILWSNKAVNPGGLGAGPHLKQSNLLSDSAVHFYLQNACIFLISV